MKAGRCCSRKKAGKKWWGGMDVGDVFMVLGGPGCDGCEGSFCFFLGLSGGYR